MSRKTMNPKVMQRTRSRNGNRKTGVKHWRISRKCDRWNRDRWHLLSVIYNASVFLFNQGQNAPVDTMGCHKCHDDTADEKTQRYHILIALMLSSQTKDQTNFAAMQRLREHGLTPQNIVSSDVNVLEKLINPVSFYKVSRFRELRVRD